MSDTPQWRLWKMRFVRHPGPLLLVLLGALLGAVVAQALGTEAVIAGLVAGALVGSLSALGLEKSRVAVFSSWLRNPSPGFSDQFAGLTADIAYRVDRLLQSHARALLLEREKLQSFRAAIDASPNGVLVLNEQQQIIWCNRNAASHFGIDAGRDHLQLATNIVRAPEFVAHLRSARYEEAVQFIGPAGRRLGVHVRPFVDGFLILSQDLTDGDRAERMRREFMTNVSHEIQTPLTVISGFIETLGDTPTVSKPVADILDLMRQQSDRMKSIVNDLLVLADLEGRGMPSRDEWFSAKGLAEAALRYAGQQFPDRSTVEMATIGSMAQIAGSRDEIQTALNHLVSNACRYCEPGTRIQILIDHLASGELILRVTDEGPGIGDEHLHRLTERFYRVDSDRSRETGGTGLGLAVVKEIVTRHDGLLEIESTPGQGSSFSLRIPASRIRKQPSTEPA